VIKIYPFDALGKADFGWLKANYHFSFSRYQNPDRTGFGKLLVINDDWVKAGRGFDTHGHRDMEIITYVRSGAILHKDNAGNVGRTEAGNVQVMSAGSGVEHSEHNLDDVDTTLYQIWIEPNRMGVAPRWDTKEFPKSANIKSLNLIASGDKNDDALFIYQDAKIYAGRMMAGTKIVHKIINQAYILASEGEFEIDGKPMHKGDGAEVTEQTEVTITAILDSEILVIDVPAN
jgi:hypothetical protein